VLKFQVLTPLFQGGGLVLQIAQGLVHGGEFAQQAIFCRKRRRIVQIAVRSAA
jgi:hypothetical protein